MPNQTEDPTKAGKSWLSVWWLLIALIVGFIAGTNGGYGTLAVGAIMVILVLIALNVWIKGRWKNALQLLAYIFALAISGYAGATIKYIIPFLWIAAAIVIGIFLVYIRFKYGKKRESAA